MLQCRSQFITNEKGTFSLPTITITQQQTLNYNFQELIAHQKIWESRKENFKCSLVSKRNFLVSPVKVIKIPRTEWDSADVGILDKAVDY